MAHLSPKGNKHLLHYAPEVVCARRYSFGSRKPITLTPTHSEELENECLTTWPLGSHIAQISAIEPTEGLGLLSKLFPVTLDLPITYHTAKHDQQLASSQPYSCKSPSWVTITYVHTACKAERQE